MFAPLACQAILDLNVLVCGRVPQHLETWVLGRELLIVSQNGLLADIRRASRHEAHRILRPDVHQSLVVLGPRKFNVYLVQLFDGRQVRGMRVPSQKPADSSAVLIQGMERKRLDISRIAAIRTAAGVPLTLHGGSGTDDEDFRKAIQAGIAMIHINTELRVAWRRGLEEALRRNADSVAPYKLLPEVMEKVKAVVVKRLKLFSGNS
jgi:hypothetical protein